MFWVELLAHGCDAASCDGLLAAGAQGAALLVVVRLAVGLAVVIKEAAIYEWRETFLKKGRKKKKSEKVAELMTMGYQRILGAFLADPSG